MFRPGQRCYVKRRNPAENMKPVTYDELCALKDDESVLIIDVRESQELQETGIIPGSINIPFNELVNALDATSAEEFSSKYNREKPNFNTPLIFSCKTGMHSEKAQNIAFRLGYSNARNYKGGWIDWKNNSKKT